MLSEEANSHINLCVATNGSSVKGVVAVPQ